MYDTGGRMSAPIGAAPQARGLKQQHTAEEDEGPLCKKYEGREYNAETLAAFEEADRMLADPSIGRRYASAAEMFTEFESSRVHG
jgi:hypothetical protein